MLGKTQLGQLTSTAQKKYSFHAYCLMEYLILQGQTVTLLSDLFSVLFITYHTTLMTRIAWYKLWKKKVCAYVQKDSFLSLSLAHKQENTSSFYKKTQPPWSTEGEFQDSRLTRWTLKKFTYFNLTLCFTETIDDHIYYTSEHNLNNLPAYTVWLYFSSYNEYVQDYIWNLK